MCIYTLRSHPRAPSQAGPPGAPFVQKESCPRRLRHGRVNDSNDHNNRNSNNAVIVN